MALAFSPDSRWLASGGSGSPGAVKIWDLTTGREEVNLAGLVTTILSLAWAPDSRQLITGGGGTADPIRVWDAETGALIKSLGSHLRILALTRDGRRLYTTSDSSRGGQNAVRVLAVPLEDAVALARERLTRSLTPSECRQYLHSDCPAGN